MSELLQARESILQAMAIEIDQAVRIAPVTHVKHHAVPNNHEGLACLESYLIGTNAQGKAYGLHAWGQYGDMKAPSNLFPDAPRGFVVTLKADTEIENRNRGSSGTSIPPEAKTRSYQGDYIKIDWVYPHKDIMGLGIPRQYFYAVERAVKNAGYPSLHVDATNNGFSYWAREEFGLKIAHNVHAGLDGLYQTFRREPEGFIEYAKSLSAYVPNYDGSTLPDEINLDEAHTIPSIFLEALSAIFIEQGVGHLHFYKKF